mmetsp:Transcript_65817/g.190690  ORF Transcript_65817/g.190690 Transcript_65817/m.190690 type:complete len:254 (+) Transcript_65817:362-1123(+)
MIRGVKGKKVFCTSADKLSAQGRQPSRSPRRTRRRSSHAHLAPRRRLELAVVRLDLLFQLREREHRHAEGAHEVRQEVAVLDPVGQPGAGAQQGKESGEADVHHQGNNHPLVQREATEQEDDRGEEHALEDRAPNHPGKFRVPSVEGPTAHLFNDCRDRNIGQEGAERKAGKALARRLGHGQDEEVEGLAVLVHSAGLLSAQKDERLATPEQDESVGQPRHHGGRLQGLQGAVSVRQVPARRQQCARGRALGH